jgi:3-oxoacyl-[acyl-carrier protein] reductase
MSGSARPRTVLVTGAGTGIGSEAARQLADGNHLVLHHHASADGARALQAELQARCASVVTVAADLTTDAGCLALGAAVGERFDALDVLVNNAGGMLSRRQVEALDWAHLLDTFTLNALSCMRITALCAPLLRRGNDACVVNVSSIAMRHGAPSATAYGAAKAAVDAFTRGAAKELAPDVRVNAVAPGIVDTRFHDRVTSAERMRQFVDSTPLQRVGTVLDVARTIRFLVDSDFITGETVDCNGGLSMR